MVRPNAIPEERRVVITGMGVVAPNGLDLKTFWSSIREGRSAGGLLTRFPPGNSPATSAAQIDAFDPGDYMDAKLGRRLEASHQYGVAAAVLAQRDSGLNFRDVDADRIGVVEGTSSNSTENVSIQSSSDSARSGTKSAGPHTLFDGYGGAGVGEIARELHVQGHAITINSSSASGNDAIGYALSMIRYEEMNIMVAGGSEAPIQPGIWRALCLSRVLSRQNEQPGGAMRPFDRHRDGILLGEGAAYVVMEELSYALSRGARIYAEIIGHGRSCEAYHPVAPHPDGIGPHRAMQKALRRARIELTEVDYINAHGTATAANDMVETKAIKRLFGAHAYRLGISSTKPVTGHAAGRRGRAGNGRLRTGPSPSGDAAYPQSPRTRGRVRSRLHRRAGLARTRFGWR